MTDPVTPPTGSGRSDESAATPETASDAHADSAATSDAQADSAATAVLPLNATVPFPVSETDTEVLPIDTTVPFLVSETDTEVLPFDTTVTSATAETDTDVLPFDTTVTSATAETAVFPAEAVIPEFTASAAPRQPGVPVATAANPGADAGATVPPTVDWPRAPTVPAPATAPPAPAAPVYAAPGASAPETWPTAPARRRHPLFGTIFWGTVMLAFSGFIIYRTLVPGETDPALWLLGGVILMGLVLIVAGIAAAARRAT